MGVSCMSGVVTCHPPCQCGSWPHWPHSHFDCQCALTGQSELAHWPRVAGEIGATDYVHMAADGVVADDALGAVLVAGEGHSQMSDRSLQNCDGRR